MLEPLPDATPSKRRARAYAWSVFAAVAAGILIARFAFIQAHAATAGGLGSPLLFGIAGLLAAALLVVPSRASRPLMLIAAVFAGAGAAHSRLAEQPRDHLAFMLPTTEAGAPLPLVRLRGTVLDRPASNSPEPGTLDAKLARFSRDTASFTLRVDSIVRDNHDGTAADPTPASGTVRVYADGLSRSDLIPGDRVAAQGTLGPTRGPVNPGQPDALLWARQSGRAGALHANAETIERIEQRGLGMRFSAARYRVTDLLHARASSLLDTDRPCAPIVRAMLLGERSPDGRQAAGFARTGVSHLLAISGFHLAVLIALTVGGVRLLGDFPRTEAVTGLAFIAAYLAIIPARTPIVRAALLATLVLLAHYFGRRWDKLTLLGWIAALIVALRPMDLTTLGFQLTFGVTALLMWLANTQHPWAFGNDARTQIDAALQPDRRWSAAVFDRARNLAATSLLVWLVSAPVIIWHTGSFNPITPAAVIVATPIAVAIQVSGMAGMLLSAVSAPIGGHALDAAHGAACLLRWFTGAFDRVPTGAVAPRVSVVWAAVAVGASVFFLVRARLRDPLPWAAIAGVVFWFMLEARAANDLDRSVAARVDMLSVGDGSCLLVRSGGAAFLWDAGSLTPGLGVRTIPRSLRDLGAARVPTAIITHANIDHYAALPDAARPIGLERVFVSTPALKTMLASPPESAEWLFLRELTGLGVAVLPLALGDELSVGPSTLRVLWPPSEPPATIRARNDRSLVARLEVPTDTGTRRVLLNGDVQRAAMLMLLAEHALEPGAPSLHAGLLNADVVEMPHHGSYHEVAEAYLLAAKPSVIMQSTGPSRADDRRWNGVARRLDARWGVTALHGALSVRILNGGSVELGSVRSGAAWLD